jgi:hypothetical protein
VWARNEAERSGRAALTESPEVSPAWAMNFSAPSTPSSNPRIAELERQIQRLNRELEQLKSQPPGTSR